jgi:hypothetical protein
MIAETALPAGTCAFHPEGDRTCYICQRPDGARRCSFGDCRNVATVQLVHRDTRGEVAEVRLVDRVHGRLLVEMNGGELCSTGALPARGSTPEPPSYYCPTCARPRGNQHHADECVCAAAGVALAKTVHVPGGQRAALAAAEAGRRSLGLVDVARRSVIPASDAKRMLASLRVAGPKVPAEVQVTLTDRGWRIEAGPAGQGDLFGGGAGRFVAELRVCPCDRTGCAKPRCQERDHCHGTTWGERHAERVEAFITEVAKSYAGKVTLPVVPRHPREGEADIRL